MMLDRLILLGVALLASSPPEGRPQDGDLAAYRAAASEAGDDPEAHVRLALWCEARGLPDERREQLEAALRIDPDHPKARGLLGQVEDGGRWERPEQVAERALADSELAARLAKYNARRARTPMTQEAQWRLALWCRQQGLEPEALAHLTAVTHLSPPSRRRGLDALVRGQPRDLRGAAMEKLGYRRHHGRWMTDEQIRAEREEAQAQERADRRWRKLLEGWKDDLRRDGRRERAEAELAGVDDPRAVPSIWKVLATGGSADQARAAQVLGQIDAPAASRALARLAVFSPDGEVRRAATETLRGRDPREFLGGVIELVRRPLRYTARPVAGLGSTGELFVEGNRYNIRRRYTTPDHYGDFSDPRKLWAYASVAPFSNDTWNGNFALHNLQEASRAADSAWQRQALDVAAVERTNAAIRAINARALPALAALTGQDFGADPDAWASWWFDRRGYRYERPKTKPTYDQVVRAPYRVHFISCFAAGTPVQTLTGPRPIEAIQVGDRVLTQDTRIGALGYQPVLRVHHNPPGQTLQVRLGGETLLPSIYHRFWVAGRGWVMARDLKPGDEVRVLGGRARVESIEPGEVVPVFNLDVAVHRDFFVGRSATLTHDNSLPEPELSPFDSAPAVADERADAVRTP